MPMPRAQASPSLTALAGARPDKVDYQWEAFSDVIQEALPLLRQHWTEIGLDHDKCPLEPNWEALMAYERAGQIALYTARHEGDLVGYNCFIVHGRLHYQSTLFALNDVIWLHPFHREGWTGVKLVLGAEREFRRRGVKFVEYGPKLHFPKFGKLLEKLGYSPFEVRYRKFIGD